MIVNDCEKDSDAGTDDKCDDTKNQMFDEDCVKDEENEEKDNVKYVQDVKCNFNIDNDSTTDDKCDDNRNQMLFDDSVKDEEKAEKDNIKYVQDVINAKCHFLY